ncbi:extracellular solute-binding protein [Paenibacillus apiarius]|uniref:Extracellular solute-binding protein n=1 Tax=Paenibacillus apiarius TaxID=46240 RepID=A0ABT4DW78_9BACL|nr:extracellular solute-binding protein [Paenibacillus apiarius]MCY9513027.1 extracellular solute-binding protein [Paenibacillus apiarius]MCY9521617.1 extracellular solute-binding protein [Paenibacillus apiarius]MCY9551769.1 extracellular solute-binding protein [Paenibacillus apiarius]MCY9560442.1 extracellular solute-binding protein [Paenibacillus apiarius]MCY9685308.1 extracellular solute-binding protein [Paenibacillus apiarius]
MKRKQKISLVVALIIGLIAATACGKQEEAQKPEGSPATGANGVLEVSTVRASDPYLKFDKGEDFDNNSVYDAYEKDAGVRITNKWIADGSQFKEKLKMAIASNDIPDFFPVEASQLQQLIEADMIMDLTDVYEQTATPETKKFMMMDGGTQMKSATFDGKLMAIPQTGNPYTAQFLWVRSDWLKKLNLPEPKTMQDLLTIMEAFATKDPGGTGKSYGLALNKKLDDGATGLVGFLNGFHAYLDQWIDDGSGKLINSDIQPEMKEALRTLQEMFKKGLIDPEFAVKDTQKASEMIFGDSIGVLYGAEWTPAQLVQGAVKDGKVVQEWSVYPLPSIDEKLASTQIGLGASGYYVVSKKAKNPEAVIKLLNQWIVVDNHPTEEDKVYEFGKDRVEKSSNYWLLNPLTVYNQTNDNGVVLPKAIADKDESLLQTKEHKTRYGRAMKYVEGDLSMWWEYLISGPKGSLSIIPYMKEHNLFNQNKFYGAPTPTMVEKNEILNRKRDEVFVKIIMNQVSVDEFDKFVADWKKLGGDEITEEVNEWYAKNK